MTKWVDAALWYSKQGCFVFPLKPGDKTPATSHGVHDATIDGQLIQQAWDLNPNANIGISCGPTGWLVLDFDMEKQDYAGAELLAKLSSEYPTSTDLTGGGGRHLIYLQPEELKLGNKRQGLPAGVDVRGAGGYIVAPPSVHPSGRRYTWQKGFGPHEVSPAPLPAFIVDLLKPVERSQPVAAVLPVNGQSSPYVQKALQDELTNLARAAEGNRNEQLNRASFSLGQLIGGNVLAETDVLPALLNTALAIGLSEREAQRTIDSGIAAGTRDPRGVPVSNLIRIVTQTDNGQTHTVPAIQDVERLTDMGNSRRFARLHGEDLRFVHEWGWVTWSGMAWEFDRTGEVMRRAKMTTVSFLAEHNQVSQQAQYVATEAEKAIEADDSETAEAKTNESVRLHNVAKHLLQWAKKCQARARLEAMIVLAQSEPPIPAVAADYDNQPWLLNVQNGTLDLRTGELRKHDRTDLLTVTAPVTFNSEAKCPTWLAFLDRIMAGAQDLVSFLQRVIGYSLTGDVTEQKLFVLHGGGANGKSTLVNAALALFGKDYAAQAAPDLLVIGKGRHPTELADLRGKRLVASIEVDEGKRLAEGLVKQLTGGDKVKARYMRQDFFEFDPTHKLMVVTNHKPQVRGTDHAIWRRICLIPFEVTIPDAEQDKALPVKLAAELPGILNWAVEGCLEWQRRGLAVPQSVLAATEDYRHESDTLGAFLDECTIEGETLEAKAGDMYQSYRSWCEDNGEKAVTNKTLAKRLADRGYDKYRQRKGWYYIGFGLLEPEKREQFDETAPEVETNL